MKAAARNNLNLNCRYLFAHSLISFTSHNEMQAHNTVKKDFIELDKSDKTIIKLSCVAANKARFKRVEGTLLLYTHHTPDYLHISYIS